MSKRFVLGLAAMVVTAMFVACGEEPPAPVVPPTRPAATTPASMPATMSMPATTAAAATETAK